MGGPEFVGVVKGGNLFFSVDQRDRPESFEVQRGGTKIFSQNSAQYLLNNVIQNIFAPLAQLFSLQYFMPQNMFTYKQIFLNHEDIHSLT